MHNFQHAHVQQRQAGLRQRSRRRRADEGRVNEHQRVQRIHLGGRLSNWPFGRLRAESAVKPAASTPVRFHMYVSETSSEAKLR